VTSYVPEGKHVSKEEREVTNKHFSDNILIMT